jgi:hypothetical protein
MINIFLQYGYHSYWDDKMSLIVKTPIPNELSFQDYTYLTITNAFPIGAPKDMGAVGMIWDKVRFVQMHEYNNEVAYFPLEIHEIHETLLIHNIFGNIKPSVMNMLKDLKCNLRLLIWFPTEGYPVADSNTGDNIMNSINTLQIPHEKVYFVYGDLNINKNKNGMGLGDINLYGLNYFESTLTQVTMDAPEVVQPVTEEEFVENWGKPRSKYFLYKNRQPRPYRLVAYTEAYFRDLLQYGHHSFNALRYTDPSGDLVSPQLAFDQVNLPCQYENRKNKYKTENPNKWKTYTEGFPYTLDFAADETIKLNQYQWSSTKQYLFDTHFSLVSETIVESGLIFLTEKTYNCILNYHPFVLYGSPGLLAYLKSLGYKTFDFVFDESYDNEYDPIKRLDMVLDVVEEMCTGKYDDLLSGEQMKETLIHNNKKLMSRFRKAPQQLYHYLTTHNQ